MASHTRSVMLSLCTALLVLASPAPRAHAQGQFFEQYRSASELSDYLDTLAALRPDIATVMPLGTTHESRPIEALRLRGPGDPTGRPSVLVVSGLNGAAWVGPMSTAYVADRMVRQHGSDPSLTALVNQADWYFVVLGNPDGYAWTQTDRLWRKNRRPTVDGHIGVNLNRNWPYGWAGLGSSASPVSMIYRGPFELSEVETASISAAAMAMPNLRVVVEVSAYGQRVSMPWGYAMQNPIRLAEHMDGGGEIAGAMALVHGQPYTSGFAGELGLVASGVVHDWALGSMNALGWRIELRDQGALGYVLPPEQIEPCADEALAGVTKAGEIALRTVSFTYPSPRPLISDAGHPAVVRLRITTWHGAVLQDGSVKLLARVAGQGAYQEIPMSGGPIDYWATLPDAACGQTIEYFVRARTIGGPFVTSPAAAPSEVYSAIVVEPTLLLDEDFSPDPFWFTDGAASGGFWDTGEPLGGGDRGDPPTDADGSGTALLTDPNDGDSDVESGWVAAYSPEFSMPDGGAFGYWYWLNTTDGLGPGDRLEVEISTDPAHAVWTPVRTYTEALDQWRYDEILIGDETESSTTVQFRFLAYDIMGGDIVEAGLDGLRVRRIEYCGLAVCEGDANGDDSVDFGDLNAVLSGWGTAGPIGDVAPPAGDGAIDFLDLNMVLSRWGSECQ